MDCTRSDRSPRPRLELQGMCKCRAICPDACRLSGSLRSAPEAAERRSVTNSCSLEEDGGSRGYGDSPPASALPRPALSDALRQARKLFADASTLTGKGASCLPQLVHTPARARLRSWSGRREERACARLSKPPGAPSGMPLGYFYRGAQPLDGVSLAKLETAEKTPSCVVGIGTFVDAALTCQLTDSGFAQGSAV